VTSRRTLLLGIAILVVLQVLTAFTAIGVLTRMSPAIERILQENEYSIEAGEALLAELATAAGGPAEPGSRSRAAVALERIRRNVTEPEELAPIAEIEARLEAALDGDHHALASLPPAVNRLVAINRAAMREADLEAQRLGTAGAWAAVVLAVLAFLLSLVVASRLKLRLLGPLQELARVLDEFRAGNTRRRCASRDASPDVRRLLDDANYLLDAKAPRVSGGASPAADAARAALLALLEERPGASFVVDREGAVAAANQAGLDRLAGADGETIRGALASLAEAEPATAILMEARPLRSAGWLCTLQ
jgi:hypothetical protein